MNHRPPSHESPHTTRTILSSLLHFNFLAHNGLVQRQTLEFVSSCAPLGILSWTLSHQLFVKMCFRHNRSNIIETNWSIMNEKCRWESDSLFLCRSHEKTGGAGVQIKRINFLIKRLLRNSISHFAGVKFRWLKTVCNAIRVISVNARESVISINWDEANTNIVSHCEWFSHCQSIFNQSEWMEN